MSVVIGVKFKSSNKIYYFSPEGTEFSEGEGVIVETARGVEYGKVMAANKEVPESEIVPPLKPVIRKATPADDKQLEANEKLKENALKTAAEKIAAEK